MVPAGVGRGLVSESVCVRMCVPGSACVRERGCQGACVCACKCVCLCVWFFSQEGGE